jgi:hypothetical protein
VADVEDMEDLEDVVDRAPVLDAIEAEMRSIFRVIQGALSFLLLFPWYSLYDSVNYETHIYKSCYSLSGSLTQIRLI